jgi:DNA repair protein RadA/Sms
VAAALVSSATDIPVAADMVVFGEIGLSGEIRAVAQGDLRLMEAAKLGFAQALTPARRRKETNSNQGGALAVRPIGHLQDVLTLFRPPAGATPAATRHG